MTKFFEDHPGGDEVLLSATGMGDNTIAGVFFLLILPAIRSNSFTFQVQSCWGFKRFSVELNKCCHFWLFIYLFFTSLLKCIRLSIERFRVSNHHFTQC